MRISPERGSAARRRYRSYVLFLLCLVYVFNFLDRQILSILAEDIKGDLGIDNAEMGFLLGTSFAVFYATFGIPLGRAADLVNRTHLISAGLCLWSLTTAASSLASGFGSLAVCRTLVGVGEASASPAAYSLIYDCFPARLRTTAIAIYSSGIFIGAGLGLAVGGLILVGWKHRFPDVAAAPFGLHAWQAAFLIVGAPGLLLAALVSRLEEPRRERSGRGGARAPLAAVAEELGVLLPGIGLLMLTRLGGSRAGVGNVAVLGGLVVLCASLTHAVGGELQWITLCYGAYAFASWCQKLRLVDRATFRAIFGRPTLVVGSLGFTGCFFLTASAVAWLAVFFQRAHGASAGEVGLVLGLSYAVMGFLGVTAGGVITDAVTARAGARGRLWVSAAAVAAATLAMAALLAAESRTVAYLWTLPFNFFSAMYVAPGAANVNSLVPPRIRATASAAYIVCQVLLGTALGPYVIGAMSDALAARGATPGHAMRQAMLLSLLASIPAVVLLLVAARTAAADERAARA